MTHERESPPNALTRHRECWERIAWIANETLDPREYARIDAHLQTCHECQDELAIQRRVREAMRSEEAVVLAPQAALQKLMQRIDAAASEVICQAPRPEDVASPGRPVARRPRWLALAAALQGVAIALLLAMQWRSAENTFNAPRFTTLTEAGAAGGAVIRVVFAADAALSEVNAMLRSVDAQIVAGPSEAGVYTLALRTASTDSSGTAGVDDALARLRADARVLFAESAVTRAAP